MIGRRILNSRAVRRILSFMKRMLRIITLSTGLAMIAAGAHAACYVEYKAKRDNPLELFYNVAVVSGPCTRASARPQIRAMLAAQGLTLLKILSVREQ